MSKFEKIIYLKCQIKKIQREEKYKNWFHYVKGLESMKHTKEVV
jgi:hypothetical protein